MKACVFTIVSDNYYYMVGTPVFINSFKHFHPDIDLVVFRQDMIDKVFSEKKINFYMAKPTFAKLLTDKYDLVVNMDADHVVTARMEAVFADDYDVGCPINKNDYENTAVANVTEDMFLQGGMVASRKKEFWDIWEKENVNAMKYRCQENDVMNLVIYNNPIVNKMKLKIFDKDYGYYGCKSLNREHEFYLEKKKVMCRGEQVFAYHHAKGQVFPKLDFRNMPFVHDVREYLMYVSSYGRSIKYSEI